MDLIKLHDPLNLSLEVRDRGSQRFDAYEGLHGEEIVHCWLCRFWGPLAGNAASRADSPQGNEDLKELRGGSPQSLSTWRP